MGAAARMPAMLLAIPASYPTSGRPTVRVRVSLRPGTAFSTLGTATL